MIGDIFFFLFSAGLYKSTGSYCCHSDVGIGIGVGVGLTF